MNILADSGGTPTALARLRIATGVLHRRLDHTLNIIPRLTDPISRSELIERYAAFYVPTDAVLGPFLAGIAHLDWQSRKRAYAFDGLANPGSLPEFPRPGSRSEALGMLYVLEGSTLGGRLILRTLVNAGIIDPALSFLDPYGAETGRRWREFVAVLAEELANDAETSAACDGAVTAFRHAGRTLCGADL